LPNMYSCRRFVLAVVTVVISIAPVRAWGCAGHHIVALIAKLHLSVRALEATGALLEAQPIDPKLPRYCKDEAADPFVSAATWADDMKKVEGTGTWHYIDIPRSLTHGDLSPFCEPVGPLQDGTRSGCILSAIRDQLGVLINGSQPDRARALRYIIHLVADLHQPLHVIDNNDRGGNCVPLHFGANSETTNLHALWDSGILESFLAQRRLAPDIFARQLDSRYGGSFQEWGTRNLDPDQWVWEVHEVGERITYGQLRPRIPVETSTDSVDCTAESAKVRALNIVIGKNYERAAMESIEPLLTRAGYRLAGLLNQIWP
jgi:S1/P1 Nuclease